MAIQFNPQQRSIQNTNQTDAAYANKNRSCGVGNNFHNQTNSSFNLNNSSLQQLIENLLSQLSKLFQQHGNNSGGSTLKPAPVVLDGPAIGLGGGVTPQPALDGPAIGLGSGVTPQPAPVVLDGPAIGLGGGVTPQPVLPVVLDGPAIGLGGGVTPQPAPVVLDGPAIGLGAGKF
jgi:hypothetical protein